MLAFFINNHNLNALRKIFAQCFFEFIYKIKIKTAIIGFISTTNNSG